MARRAVCRLVWANWPRTRKTYTNAWETREVPMQRFQRKATAVFQDFVTSFLSNEACVEYKREIRHPSFAEVLAIFREVADKLIIQMADVEQPVVKDKWCPHFAQCSEDL